MCDRFIEDFTNKVVEKAFKKTWLWVYRCFDSNITKYLVIEANTRNEAIWKLKLAADPYIGYKEIAPMNDAYGLNSLFHIDCFYNEPFNNYNMNNATIENFVPAFEKEILAYGYELKEIAEMDKI